MTTKVDAYLLEGCGRCPLGGTPDCKVHRWTTELNLLRDIVLDCGLTETAKWGVPCYTLDGANVLLLGAFNDYCSISFFKGVLLKETGHILVKPGPNSQVARVAKFTDITEIEAQVDQLRACIYEAIEVEKAGLQVPIERNPEPIPAELEQRFAEDPTLQSAFDALTPGRQRGYLIYFSAPKQAKTREARIEKCVGKILNGEGLHDKYQGKRR